MITIKPSPDGFRASITLPSGTEVAASGETAEEALMELLEDALGQMLYEKNGDDEWADRIHEIGAADYPPTPPKPSA